MPDDGIKETADRWAQYMLENLTAAGKMTKEEIDAADKESVQRSFNARPWKIDDPVADEEAEDEQVEEPSPAPAKKKLSPPKMTPKIKSMGYSELTQLIAKRADQARQAKREVEKLKPAKRPEAMRKVYKMEAAVEIAGEILGDRNKTDAEREEAVKAVLMEGFFS